MNKGQKAFLGLEFILLCIAVPGYIIYNGYAEYMFFFLWSACAYCLAIYWWKTKLSLTAPLKFEAFRWDILKPMFLRWILGSIAMVVFVYFYTPDKLFAIPLQRPELILPITFGYPLISALPQEFIFCVFFFWRYKPFFGEGKAMIWASAIIFAYAHVLYINPIAPPVSLIGGLIFATTYLKTKSLSLVTLEHSLYGWSLFMVGLGHYFYSGGVGSY